ncbi:uncharacterized protein DEA37_0013311, partial [Paragonimus westermani]
SFSHAICCWQVTKDGEILPDAEYRELSNRENQKRALLELIAKAIVERSLEAERIRQGRIRRTLEEICKMHRVRRMREERRKRDEETILMQLIPRNYTGDGKLNPISCNSSDHSMDKRSQIEVAKLRRIYRTQQLKERKAGRPPYLYLYEPGMPKRRVKNKARMRTRKQHTGHKGLDSFTRHSKSQDETMAATTGPEFQLRHPPGKTENDPRPRLKQKCHGDRGDRILVEEQQSESLGELDSPIQNGPSPAQALPEPDGTAENLLIAGRQPSDNCIDQSGNQAHHMHRLSCLTSGLRTTVNIPALVLSTKTPPHSVIVRDYNDNRLGVARSKSLLFQGRPLPVRSSTTAASLQDVATIHQCHEQVEKNDTDESKPVTPQPGKVSFVDNLQSPCVVRFIYLGASRLEESTLEHIVAETNQQTPRTGQTQTTDNDQRLKRWITVVQQPSGGNTITVFKGLLQPGDAFEFTSRRTYGFPFSLSLCIDGTQDSRISACCEYRHRRGVRIGGKHGHFIYAHVEGSIPCFKCQAARSVREEKRRKRKQAVRRAESDDVMDRRLDKSSATDIHNDESTSSFSMESADETVDNVVGTNLNRRSVKSTHLEHFTPTMTNLQSCLSEEKLYRRYDTEQVEGSEDSQRFCPSKDSFVSETEITQNRSYARDCEAPKDEDVYQATEYTEEDQDEEVIRKVEDEDEERKEDIEREDEGSSSAVESVCKRPDQFPDVDETNEFLFESNKNCKVTVAKVDVFYQHRMLTKCYVQTE